MAVETAFKCPDPMIKFCKIEVTKMLDYDFICQYQFLNIIKDELTKRIC